MEKFFKKMQLTSFRIIIMGFLGVVLLGTLLLMLPFATKEGTSANFFDALFTSTSAVCVTGLVVQDTATYWSGFGQGIILMLIQVGGLGVVTVALAIARFSGRKIGIMQRSLMQESISAPKVGGMVKIVGFILRGVLFIEFLGAVALAFVFCPEFGIGKGIWYSIFHSISAFCNAGFDLMGTKEKFSSLTSYSSHYVVNIVVMLLIIIGGLGFLVWEDILKNKLKFKKYRMQTKVVLSVTLILIFVPSLYYFFNDFSNMPFSKRLWLSLFQSVTSRTAGFNTANLPTMGEVGLMIMIILMLIGGSPGSTAGGMKTTTIAVLFSSAISVFKRRENGHFFKRRFDDSVIKNASVIFLMYLTLFSISGIIISQIDGVSLFKALFETSSAIGTVGLSLGLTAELGLVSRLILICLMFFGRVGGLTLIFATVSNKNSKVTKYPKEHITVG